MLDDGPRVLETKGPVEKTIRPGGGICGAALQVYFSLVGLKEYPHVRSSLGISFAVFS